MTDSEALTAAGAGDQSSRQAINQRWWSEQPMTYEGREPLRHDVGTEEWFREIDQRFLDSAFYARGADGAPFGRYLRRDILRAASVLEIGCGMGTHAQLLAEAGAKVTAIDLTDTAVATTRRRFDDFGLRGDIRRADAEQLPFTDRTLRPGLELGRAASQQFFERCLGEVTRVLRPGGRLMMMVYHRPSLIYEVHNCLIRGLILGQRLRRSFEAIYEQNIDGAFARTFRRAEMRRHLAKDYATVMISVTGQKAELFPIPPSKLKQKLEMKTPDWLASGVLSMLGFFLVVDAAKR